MDRLQLLNTWVASQFPETPYAISPASADASFRRYFRVHVNSKTLIVMDAPPDVEDCTPFLQVSQLLVTTSVHVPKVLAQDLEQGFLLLSDLGDTTYLDALTKDPSKADALYGDAVDALIQIQSTCQLDDLPLYDADLLLRELNLFSDWYIVKHLKHSLTTEQKKLIDSVFKQIIERVLVQPKVFVHRDYHSRNLMVASPNPGIIDYQDAVVGPITYDLVSLFKDAYIVWEEAQILDWTIRYWEKARLANLPVADDFADFYSDFEWMGVQRHIKVLGIFTRLCYRDGKEAYVNDIPLVMDYLRKACERYYALKPLLNLLDELDGIEPDTKVGYTF